jgi:hypothetical protein
MSHGGCILKPYVYLIAALRKSVNREGVTLSRTPSNEDNSLCSNAELQEAKPPEFFPGLAQQYLTSTSDDENVSASYGEEVFQMLVATGLDIENANRCGIGRTIWFWAAQEGHYKVLDLLLRAGFPADLRAVALYPQ